MNRRSLHLLIRGLLVGAVVTQLGSCYRAEIDLSSLLSPGGGSAGTSAAGAIADGAGYGSGASGGAISAGEGPGTGGLEAGGEGGGAANAGQGSALGGAGGGQNPINTGEECSDEPLSADHQSCRDSGIKPNGLLCMPQDVTASGWMGCAGGGCLVCTTHGEVPGYPYYFNWHPCCSRNLNCEVHVPVNCNELCPPPTERDKIPPCP